MGLKHAGLPFIVLKEGSAVSLRTSTIAASSPSRFFWVFFFLFQSDHTAQEKSRQPGKQRQPVIKLLHSKAALQTAGRLRSGEIPQNETGS